MEINDPKYISIKEAAARYSVSTDWIRRNKHIHKTHLSPRLVRVSVAELDAYFRNHTL